MNYSHVVCYKCCGVVRLCNDMTFSCQECGEEVPLRGSDYDILMKNEKTGWVFPMINNTNKDILTGKGLKPLTKDCSMPSGIRKYP